MSNDLDEGTVLTGAPLPGELSSPAPSNAVSGAVTIIEPAHGWVPLKLGELLEYREVLFFLIWRDVKVRYRQTLIGASWAIIQPVVTMVVFALFFGRLARMPSDGLPYPLFTFAALVPWTFFARAMAQSSESLVGNQHLITKVYIPRLLLPLARVLGGLPDLGLSFLVLLGMVWWYRGFPSLTGLLWMPPLILLAMATALGVGLWLSALNVQYRDIQHVIPFLTQVWLFATPIAYPASLLSEPARTLYGLNPMVGVVEGFRAALVGSSNPPAAILAISTLATLCMLVSGAFFFRRVERSFADVI